MTSPLQDVMEGDAMLLIRADIDRAQERVRSAENYAASNDFRSATYRLTDAIESLSAAIQTLAKRSA